MAGKGLNLPHRCPPGAQREEIKGGGAGRALSLVLDVPPAPSHGRRRVSLACLHLTDYTHLQRRHPTPGET